MPPVKTEPVARETQKAKRSRTAADEPSLVRSLGAAVGLCSPLSKEQINERIDDFIDFSSEPRDKAIAFLEAYKYDTATAKEAWAVQHAITLSDEEEATENQQPNGQTDVVRTLSKSSYGRIIKVTQRFDALARVRLPTIVVIGSESAGKSSTLERIAGLSLFPRDDKICTRMPIKLSLINSGDSESRVTLKFPGRVDLVVTEADAASAVGKLMSEVVPPGHGVIDEQLTIEVRKPSVPTLDLVDLPGIVAASIEGEPADMMSRTRALSERYLRDHSTIVVAVVPANITRVRDSQAIQLVQAAKKEEVTLGVLAKADLAHDPRYKQRKQRTPYWQLKDRLAGKADDMVKLLSWVAVKNRDTLVEEEEASSLQESCETERKWFVDEAKLGGEQCGIAALLSEIDALFTLYIKQTWVPAAVSQLEQESAGIAAQIDELGRSPSSFTLDELLAAFTDAFTEVRGFIIEPGMYEVAKDYVSSIVAQKEISSALQAAMQSGSSSHPTIRTAIFRKMLKQKLVDGLPGLLPLFTEFVVKAVKAAFSSDIKPPLRLERFEVLRDALCEASGMLLEGCLDGFVESAAQTMTLHLMGQVGDPVWSGGDYVNGKVPRIIAEVALRELIVPVVMQPDELRKTLLASVHSVAQPRPSRKCKAAAGGASASEATDADGPADVSHLLIESCAAKRTELVARKHHLFVALAELRKL